MFAGTVTGRGFMTWLTEMPCRADCSSTCELAVCAAFKRNQPMKAVQRPLKKFPMENSMIPSRMKRYTHAWPTEEAMHVDFLQSPVTFQMIERRMHPPSSGNPGI